VSGLNRLLGSGAKRASLADTAQWLNSSGRSSRYVMTDLHRCMPLVAGHGATASTDSAQAGNTTVEY